MSTRPNVAMFGGRRFEQGTKKRIYEPSCAVQVPNLPVQNFMPPSGKPFEATGGVTLPAIGASAVVLQKTVPKGNNGYIRRIANVFVGGGFTDFSGGIVWQILIDLTKGTVAPDFDNIIASLGTASNPSTIDGIHVMEGSIFALIVKNISIVVSGQVVGGRLGGSFHSIPDEPPDLAF